MSAPGVHLGEFHILELSSNMWNLLAGLAGAAMR